MKHSLIKVTLLLTSLEGLFSFLFIFSIPSMEKNALLMGFSASRLMTGGVILAICLPVFWATLRAFSNLEWCTQLAKMLDGYLVDKRNLFATSVALILLILLGVGIVAVFSVPFSLKLGMIRALYERLFALIIWLVLFSLQLLLAMFYSYLDVYRQKRFFDWKLLTGFIFVLVTLILTVFHWLVLYLQVTLFIEIPNWYWKFRPKPFSANDLLFLLVALIVVGASVYLLWRPRPMWRSLLIIILLGYVLQIVFGLMDGNGFESIRRKFMKAGHSVYTQYACSDTDLSRSLLNYETLYGKDMYLDTKPPGVLLFHQVIQKLSDPLGSLPDFSSRYERMTTVMAYVFPLLSMAVLVLMALLAKALLADNHGLAAALLYIVLPNVILMTLEIDQVFYPILLIAGLLLWQKALTKFSFSWSVVCGCYAYIAIFFTYSLLPLLPLIVIWSLVDFFRCPQKPRLIGMIKIGIGLGVGVVICYFAFYGVLNYNFILRYQNAFASHQFYKKFNPEVDSLFNALLVNNIEFVMWSGVPVILLACAGFFRSGVQLFRQKATTLDSIAVAFGCTYILLNLTGQTRSEVGRLWIFMLPLITMLAAEFLTKFMKKRRDIGLITVILLQLMTLFLTYKFQDAINL